MRKVLLFLLAFTVMLTACTAFAAEYDYTIVTDRESNQLALASVYYTAETGEITQETAKVIPGSTMALYADVINTYTLMYMTKNQKIRYTQQLNSSATGNGVVDAKFYLFMCVFDGDKLVSCMSREMPLWAYPGFGLNYRQRDVKIGSVTVPADVTAPTLKSFIWRKDTNGASDSTAVAKDAAYIKNSFAPEFAPLVLTSQSNDNEIKSISLDGEYGYVNHDRNSIKFIFEGQHEVIADPVVNVAQSARVESSGTLADGTLSYKVIAENGDEKTYSVSLEDSYTTHYAQDFDECTIGAATSDNTDLTLKTTLTNQTYNIAEREDGNNAFYVDRTGASSASGSDSVRLKFDTITSNLKNIFFKFDYNLNDRANATLSWYSGSEVKGYIAAKKTSSGSDDATKYAFGTSMIVGGSGAGMAGNSVYTGTMGEWNTFALLGSMHTQGYAETQIGTKAHQFMEVYNFVGGIPQYLGEYFIFDTNKSKKTNAGEDFTFTLDTSTESNNYAKKSDQWGFGYLSKDALGGFGLDNITLMGK